MDRMTEKEREFIRENAGVLTCGEIATALGRNYYTVRLELAAIGHKSIHRWTEEEDNILRAQYGSVPTVVIASELGVSVHSVQLRAQKIGVTIKPQRRATGRKKFVTKFVKSVKYPRRKRN